MALLNIYTTFWVRDVQVIKKIPDRHDGYNSQNRSCFFCGISFLGLLRLSCKPDHRF